MKFQQKKETLIHGTEHQVFNRYIPRPQKEQDGEAKYHGANSLCKIVLLNFIRIKWSFKNYLYSWETEIYNLRILFYKINE